MDSYEPIWPTFARRDSRSTCSRMRRPVTERRGPLEVVIERYGPAREVS